MNRYRRTPFDWFPKTLCLFTFVYELTWLGHAPSFESTTSTLTTAADHHEEQDDTKGRASTDACKQALGSPPSRPGPRRSAAMVGAGTVDPKATCPVHHKQQTQRSVSCRPRGGCVYIAWNEGRHRNERSEKGTDTPRNDNTGQTASQPPDLRAAERGREQRESL